MITKRITEFPKTEMRYMEQNGMEIQARLDSIPGIPVSQTTDGFNLELLRSAKELRAASGEPDMFLQMMNDAFLTLNMES